MRTPPAASVDLYWVPLGAGGHSVRYNGRVFEAIVARRQHRARYDLYHAEVRCWRGGSIPDLAESVGGPRRLSADPLIARRLRDLVPTVPTPVWGRDELRAGEMWNSNSVAAWLIATTGLSTDDVRMPARGRAPGWDAGLEVARRALAQCGVATAAAGSHATGRAAGTGGSASAPERG